MIPNNKLILNEESKRKMLILGLTKDQIKHILAHGAKVRFMDRTWKSHAHIKVAYKNFEDITKVDVVHYD
ncbi:MAG: hypothetical protein AABW87_00740 [Nanoarchaeota archaeon]